MTAQAGETWGPSTSVVLSHMVVEWLCSLPVEIFSLTPFYEIYIQAVNALTHVNSCFMVSRYVSMTRVQ